MEAAGSKGVASRREILLVSGMARQRRLLREALQTPTVDAAFAHVARRRHLLALRKSVDTWKNYVQSHRQFMERFLVVKGKLGNTTLIQKVVRGFMPKKSKEHVQPFIDSDDAALLLQRVFRGYMGRGRVILIERSKLLRFLRSWSNGHTLNLYHMSTLQEAEAQALIYTAISMSCLPSRPIRDLPSLPLIQKYRAGLFGLYWQVNFRRSTRKAERANARHERQLMYYEDMCSKVWESRTKARMEGDLQREKDLQELLQRQDDELLRRKEYDSNLLILEMHNKKAVVLRAQREAAWRDRDRAQKACDAQEQVVRRHFEREWELMKREDVATRAASAWDQARREERLTLQAEAARVEISKRMQWQADLVLLRRGRPTIYTEAYLLDKVRCLHEVFYEHWVEFVQALPLDGAFQTLSRQLPDDVRERTARSQLDILLQECSYSYRAMDSRIACLLPTSNCPDRRKAKLLAFFDWSSALVDHPWRSLFSAQRVVPAIRSINREFTLPLERDLPGDRDVSVALSAQLSIDPTTVLQLEKVMQYKFLRNEHREIHRELSVDLLTFEALHAQLQGIRKAVKEGKQLRSERQKTLQRAEALEKNLSELREGLVRRSLRLYDLVYHAMKLCIELFCVSTEDAEAAAQDAVGAADAPELSLGAFEQTQQHVQPHVQVGGGGACTPKVKGQYRNGAGGKKPQVASKAASSSSSSSSGAATVSKSPRVYNATRSVSSPLLTSGRRKHPNQSQRLDPAERVFDPHSDDCTLFWQQLVYVLTFVVHGRWSVSPLEMVGWPAPPKPTHEHTGARSAVKNLPKETVAKRKLSMTARQQAIISYLKMKSDDKTSKPAMKFHDIPGLNLFVEDLSAFDFLPFARGMRSWANECVRYMRGKEQAWRADKLLYGFVAMQRVDYLVDAERSVALRRADSPYLRLGSPADGLDAVRRVSRACATDVFELLLCTSHLTLQAASEADNPFNLFPSVLRAEDLDSCIGRHPISVVAHFLMVDEILSNRTPTWPAAFPSRPELLARHRNALAPALCASAPGGLLRALDRETREAEALLDALEQQRLLVLHQTLQSNMPASSSLLNVMAGVSSIVLRARELVLQHLVVSEASTERWDFRFPLFAQPVLHLGRVSGKESFFKLLMRERALGIDGVYARRDVRDAAINSLARKLLRHLQQRVVISQQFRRANAEYLVLDEQRKLMIYEDARSYLHEVSARLAKQDEARSRRDQTCWAAAWRWVGCWAPTQHAKVHTEKLPEGEDRLKQAALFMRKYDPRNYPRSEAKLAQLTRPVLRTIFQHDYDFRCEPVRRLVNSMEAFRSVNLPALQAQLQVIAECHEGDHSRTVSWSTGERVCVDRRGRHVAPQETIFPQIAPMSTKYSSLSTRGLLREDEGTQADSRGNPYGRALRANAAPDGDLGCDEFLLGGGLQSMFAVLRVVEDEQVSARGTAIYERIGADQCAAFLSEDLDHSQLLYPASSDGATVGLALRSGFSYHPVCSCCRSRHAASWSSRQTFLCDAAACARSGPVAVEALPSSEALRRQIASVVLRKRYGQLDARQMRSVVRFQAIVRAVCARRRWRKLGAAHVEHGEERAARAKQVGKSAGGVDMSKGL